MAYLQMLVAQRALRRERVFRDRTSPLDIYNDMELYERYRFNRETIFYLIDILKDELEFPTRRSHSIPATLQVTVALRFYACGTFQSVIGDTVGIHKSSVCRIVRRVSHALARRLNNYVIFPEGEELAKNQQDFYGIAGLAGVVGAIDCTHVRIQGPSEHENDFVNRKGFHSINVQTIVNAKGQFINVVAKWPGSTHDSRIIRESLIGQRFENGELEGILVGDSGYPCTTWLLTPFLNPLTEAQRRYNEAQTRTRLIAEQSYGWCKRRFHVLHGEIRMTPRRSCTIIGACTVLHNLAIDRRLPHFDNEPQMAENVIVDHYNGPEDGHARRQHIVDTFFTR